MTDETQEPSAAQKAKIASRAQAAAHKELRDAHPQEYQDAYQRAKRELTAQTADR